MKVFIDMPKAPPIEIASGRTLINDISVEESLDAAVQDLLATVPKRFLAQSISRKFLHQSVELTHKEAERIADWMMNGQSDPFPFEGDADRTVILEFDSCDIAEIEQGIEDFVDRQLPNLLDSVAEEGAVVIQQDLEAGWSKESGLQKQELQRFRQRMLDRWGPAMGKLKLLITIVREWADDATKAMKRMPPSDEKKFREIQLRLTARACQTTDEIVCLLENGFADGAMARWRTLHEVNVIAAILCEHGWPLAERYLDHQAVESKRAMDKYLRCCDPLGLEPLSESESARITRAYKAVVEKYGNSFRGDWGWAAYHLKLERVTFADLETATRYGAMRSYYQLGNDNVHVGAKSLYFRLGLIDDYTAILGGRSNAGLGDPGQNTAITLWQIVTATMMTGNFSEILKGKIVERIARSIPAAFMDAEEKLKRDHREKLAEVAASEGRRSENSAESAAIPEP